MSILHLHSILIDVAELDRSRTGPENLEGISKTFVDITDSSGKAFTLNGCDELHTDSYYQNLIFDSSTRTRV